MPFENIVEKATEQLYADERLRSNLVDSDATAVMNWAVDWITRQIETAAGEPDAKQIAERALAQVRPLLKGINVYAARGEWNVSATLVALEPALKADQPLEPTQVAELLTAANARARA